MALQSKIELYIDGKAVYAFKELKLYQEISEHHTLNITCRTDVLEGISGGEYTDESKDFLGQIVTLTVQSIDNLSGYKELRFKGVVSEITSAKGFLYQNGDLVIIKAQSSSILADDGPHYTSFSDVNLASIVSDTLQKYDRSKLSTVISPQYTNTIHYTVRQGESSFQYVRRLAAQYGEWFYYDGEQLLFGKPQNKEEVTLTYGQDLQEFSRKLTPVSNNYQFFTNDYLSDQHHEMATTDINSGANGYHGFTSQKSKELYPHKTNIFVNTYNDPQQKQRLDRLVEQQKKASEIKQVVISGSSDNPGVTLGAVVKIHGVDGGYGKFRITKVDHEALENGKYQNSFEGLSTEIEVYPNTDIMAYPKSETLVAVITDNADPEGMSRVKAQFFWQKPMGEFTPWMRVLTPHAGGEKGFHFIPEVGEEVLIGFEGGNAERPYVLGTLYNGSANPAGWKTDKNDVKAIRTRSGHTIEFNDTKGAEFITITDMNANIINIDTAKNNITITAIEKMTLNAKNFEMNIKEDAVFNIGKDTMLYTENNFETSSKNNTNTIENDMKTTVGGELAQNSGNAEIQSKRDMKIACGATASFQGGGNVKISKG